MKNTRVLTEGALMAALFSIIFLASMFIPFIGLVTLFLLPFPVIFFVLRHGIRAGVGFFIVITVISFIITGIVGLLFSFFVSAGGFVIGELFRRKKSSFAVLLGGSLTYIAVSLLFFIGAFLVLHIHPIETFQEMMRQSVEVAEKALISIGQDPTEQVEAFNETIDVLGKMTALIIIFSGVMYALLSQLFASFFLKRLGYETAQLPPIREWSFPKSFLWYYLIVSILVFMGMAQDSSTLALILLNLYPLLEVIMAIQGFAVIFHWSYVKKTPLALPIIAAVVAFILPIFLYLVRILGIIDLGFDLRKRIGSENK